MRLEEVLLSLNLLLLVVADIGLGFLLDPLEFDVFTGSLDDFGSFGRALDDEDDCLVCLESASEESMEGEVFLTTTGICDGFTLELNEMI